MQALVYLLSLVSTGYFGTVSPVDMPSYPIHLEVNPKDPLIGNWTGTAKCQVKNTSCRDENVVFHISPGNNADLYKVNADKIVSGQVVTMGELNFTFDRPTHTLTCAIPSGTWVLKVNNTHIDGTLTTTDHVVLKKLTLTKTG